MENVTVTKNRIIAELAKSSHGKLEEYLEIGKLAAQQEPEFLAHLIAWNAIKGTIRDSQVALPMVSLLEPSFSANEEYAENSRAHFVKLGPREMLRAYRFALKTRPAWTWNHLAGLVHRYLRNLEGDHSKWNRVTLQHRRTIKELYTVTRANCGDYESTILHGKLRDKTRVPFPQGSVFEAVAKLKDMEPAESAAAIINRKIPFMVAIGALGAKAHDTDILHALITRMSPTELVTNSKNLERLGVMTNPALKGAYEEGIKRASGSTANILKTTAAIETIEEEGLDQGMADKLRGLQERQIAKMGGVEGDWLILGDKSPSMQKCIESARIVAATLAKFVKGKVHLVFFDSYPRYFDVSGMDYAQVLNATRYVEIGGGTSIGCGVQYALDRKLEIDGIAIISDAAENTPPLFVDRYKKLCEALGKEPTVYLYRYASSMPAQLDRDLGQSMKSAGLDMQEFDLRTQDPDKYSLPNIVTTMRTNRYSLADEIFATRLLTVGSVLRKVAEPVGQPA